MGHNRSLTLYNPNVKSTKVCAEKTSNNIDANEVITNITEKWEKVENKTTVVLYGGAALVILWFASTIVGAVNNIPLLPKLLELIGLSYTAWFVYRYLIFKTSRQELVQDIQELKKKKSVAINK